MKNNEIYTETSPDLASVVLSALPASAAGLSSFTEEEEVETVELLVGAVLKLNDPPPAPLVAGFPPNILPAFSPEVDFPPNKVLLLSLAGFPPNKLVELPPDVAFPPNILELVPPVFAPELGVGSPALPPNKLEPPSPALPPNKLGVASPVLAPINFGMSAEAVGFPPNRLGMFPLEDPALAKILEDV